MKSRAMRRRWILLPVLGLTTVLACGRDGGSRPAAPQAPPAGDVVITRLIPARTVVADTVVIRGTGFGATAGTASFAGPGGSRRNAQIVSWSDTQLRVLVPDSAADGPVGVHAGSLDSNTLGFSVAPRLISFVNDLVPQIFGIGSASACVGCHGGTNNLYLDSAQSLMQGTSLHGPVVIRRDSAASIIVQKVSSNPPFGAQMPFGGTPLNDAEILLLSDWIDQGARNN